MCGRFPTAAPTWAEIHAQLNFFTTWEEPAEDPPPRYNVAPTQLSPIVVAEGPGHGRGLMARWEFVPFFFKAPLETKAWSSFNAKVETVAGSRAFADAFRRRRCLVPARGFYEWKREGKAKTPYFFEVAGEPLVFFAGIWDAWRGVHRGATVSFVGFAILTCPANATVAPAHDRMPVILLPEDREAWMFGEPDEALKRAGPYPAQLMRASPAHPDVGAVRNDHPGLLRADAALL